MNKEALLKEIYESSFNDEVQKLAGVKTELISGINPLNMIASPLGAIIAGFTPTKTDKEMKEIQKKTWSNILIPGKGGYNFYKRLGHSQKSLSDKK